MLFNKKCKRCGKKSSKGYGFCPYCGYSFSQAEKEDFGLLGKDDDDFDNLFKMPAMMPGFGNIFNSLLNQIDKEFKQLDKKMADDIRKEKIKPFGSGISISISTSTGKQPEIKISGFGPEFKQIKEQEEIREAKIEKPELTEEKARKIARLPKKEAETNVRRLANKIIYELSLPDVSSIKDVVINKLENSIEIKAFSKDTAYFKLIPLKLPITKYSLKDSKLILELKPES